MREDPSSAFRLRIAQALTGCQLVEEELRIYITEAAQLVCKYLGSTLPISFASKNVETFPASFWKVAKSPLGKLIEKFEKLCANDTLIGELRAFKTERNFLTHNAIVDCVNPDDELDWGAMADVEARIEKIVTDSARLRSMIHDEGREVFAHLWFDDVPAR